MAKQKLDVATQSLLIIGGINSGLAIWDINAIAWLSIGWLMMAAYAAIGLSGIYQLWKLFK